MEEQNEMQETGQQAKEQKRQKRGYFTCGLITGLAVAFLLLCGTYLTTRLQTFKAAEGGEEAVTGGQGTEENAVEPVSVVNQQTLLKMQAIEQAIELYYYMEDTDKQAMADNIYKGMVASLGDPYSEYYTAEELNEVMDSVEGIYYGIGAYVQYDKELGMCRISGVIDDSPALRADVRTNDLIYAVDAEEVYGMTATKVVSKIKGAEGTTVKLTLIRDGVYVEIEVERQKVNSPTIVYNIDDDGIAYIQITEFDTVTVDQFADALATVRGSGMKSLILDIRANPGGSLDAVVDIARMLLPEGLIVYTEDREGNRKEYSCDGTHKLDVPMVVLVDGNSASASEILAGAVKDYEIGTLLGTTTFGKGIVQQPISLGDGSAVKLTVSRYFTPKGVNIHGTGIEPNVVCEFDGERYYSEEKYDNQLEAAKELLRQK